MSALPPQKFLTLTPPPKSSFLSLAPATSASYPTKQARSHVRASDIPAGSEEVPRRASDGGLRVLKLGPVHWGEHPGDSQEDFHHII